MAEIECPTLAITEQFFAVHRLADEPLAGVWADGDRRYVYLRLHNEPYYWVVVIESDPTEGAQATWGFHSAHANVYAVIYSERLTAAEISDRLSIQPSETRDKGAPLPGNRRTYNEHRWYFRPPVPEFLDFETKLASLLESLPVKRVRSLPSDCTFRINVAYYEYQSCPAGWHLDTNALRRLVELGCELDVDLYTSGPELPD